ncbi:MAG: response regulator [Armatimonadetes bacterium]|nr:response regulator [Armatimonadota bacterium]
MKIRALVIDDSRVMRNMVKESLRKTELAEFEFDEAEDGNDGLKKFNPKSTDIIFVDWNMPNMTGIDFVRKVRSSHKQCTVPIVMVTSEKSMGKIEEALDKAGANAYITKPFTVEYMQRKLSPLFEEISAKQSKQTTGFFSKLMGG